MKITRTKIILFILLFFSAVPSMTKVNFHEARSGAGINKPDEGRCILAADDSCTGEVSSFQVVEKLMAKPSLHELVQDNLVQDNSVDQVKKFLASDDANINEQDEDGRTPLILAADGLDKKMVALLLEKKAAVNLQDALGGTALMCVVSKACGEFEGGSQLAILKMLLNREADPNIKNRAGKNVFDLIRAAEEKEMLPECPYQTDHLRKIKELLELPKK